MGFPSTTESLSRTVTAWEVLMAVLPSPLAATRPLAVWDWRNTSGGTSQSGRVGRNVMLHRFLPGLALRMSTTKTQRYVSGANGLSVIAAGAIAEEESVHPSGLSTTNVLARVASPARRWAQTARAYLALTKPLQTLLLLVTAICAYVLSRPSAIAWGELAAAALALTGAIAGCTVLNMILDRDIDAQMGRTARRPLPAGRIGVRAALIFGLALSVPGLALAWILSPLFGFIGSLGFGIDLGVYTLWLKRRTPLSILWGGISGSMPALAGRALALGRVDLVGILLAAGVLCWIPVHILTLATHYAREYCLAGVPVWPNVYGPTATRRMIALAALLDVAVLGTAGWLLGIHPITLSVLAVLGAGLFGLSVVVLIRPTERLNWVLFKYASLYLLGAFISLTVGTLL